MSDLDPSVPGAADLARAAATAADDKGATDIVVIDVAEILGICDVFVIATGRNVRQVGAIAEEVEEQLFLGHDLKPSSVEGLDARRWVLLDYGDLIVHVFVEEDRAYYRLERLY
ncbi:MAG TPA: ribosome silencing factor, partial [Microthrixaceae bacterium]|nr:ribosome silencing factor [Microthrixaceae bacterium]